MDRRGNNNNNVPTAPPAYERATNDLLFKSAITTLRGSNEWRLYMYTSWTVTFLLALYGFHIIEHKDDNERSLMYAAVIIACYSATNLSSVVRDRAEAALLQQHGKGTRLHNQTAISALMGTQFYFVLQWAMFIGTVMWLSYRFMWVDSGDQLSRYFTAASILALVSQTFNLANMVRNGADADKFIAEYDFANPAESSVDL